MLPNFSTLCNILIYFLKFLLISYCQIQYLMVCQKLLRKTDYRCCKNVADKPISDIWPINRCITNFHIHMLHKDLLKQFSTMVVLDHCTSPFIVCSGYTFNESLLSQGDLYSATATFFCITHHITPK